MKLRISVHVVGVHVAALQRWWLIDYHYSTDWVDLSTGCWLRDKTRRMRNASLHHWALLLHTGLLVGTVKAVGLSMPFEF